MQSVFVACPTLRAPSVPLVSKDDRVLISPRAWRDIELAEDVSFPMMSGGTLSLMISRVQRDKRLKKRGDVFESWFLPVVHAVGPAADLPTVSGLLDLWMFQRGGVIRDVSPGTPIRILGASQALTEFIANGLALAHKKPRFTIALQRWSSSISRTVAIDAVIDCCSCLDSLFNVQSELRLRLALAVSAFVAREKRTVRKLVYDLYGRRNDFVHGSKIPAVSHTERRQIGKLAAAVLERVANERSLPKGADALWQAL